MASNINNLFSWNSNINKKDKKYNQDCDEYWKKRTTMAADEAVRNTTCVSVDKLGTFLDDDVYAEAKQVVQGWITEQKVYGRHSDRDSFLRLSSEDVDDLRQPNVVEVHKEWQHLVSKLETNQDYHDEISQFLEQDDCDITKDKRLQSVINNLHKKSFVNKSQLRLVDSPRKIDVGKRMETRQEQVKRNREERLRNEEMRRMEKLAEKEARSEAMKMLKEEKLKKEIDKKKEEELIQLEMHRIRAEIQTKREEESKERERVRESQRLSSRQQPHTTREVQTKPLEDVNQRFNIISEIVDRKFLNKNKTMLRRCFQLWRDEVVKKRVEMKQAVVWNNWQILRRVFRAWRRDAKLSAINRKIELDQQRMRFNQRKETLALSFWKTKILKKCLIHWSLYVIDEKETRWFAKLEEMRKRKMTSYIEALQEKAKENQNKLNLLTCEKHEQQLTNESTGQPTKPYQVEIETERADSATVKITSTKPRCSSARSSSRSKNVPREAWQVTKKHANLPLDQLLDSSIQMVHESINFKSLKAPKIVNNYANRNAAQKELIAQQRSKLKEQELIISELVTGYAIHNIKEDISKFDIVDTNNFETESQNAIGNDLNDDKGSVTLESIPKKVNKFVAQMEERAKERDKIKMDRIEKQKRLDEEKRKMLAEQIAEQCKLEAEEKHKREQILREKRDKEKMREAVKKKHIQIEQEKNKKADQFYESILLKRYGIGRLKRLVEMKRTNEMLAIDHCNKKIMGKVFTAWLGDVNVLKTHQNQIVTVFYSKVLLTRCFYRFRMYKERFQFMDQLASRHYLETLTRKAFVSWRLSNHRSQIRLDKLEILSGKMYERNLLKTCFYAWRKLPLATRAEKEREKRKEIMRQKVARIIPDFKPLHFEN